MAAVVRKEVKCGAPGRIPSELAEDYAFKLNIVRFAGAVRWSLNLEREDPGGGGSLPGPVVITFGINRLGNVSFVGQSALDYSFGQCEVINPGSYDITRYANYEG
jgi:hypothetical protein